jgi:muconolactone delta-isomerase
MTEDESARETVPPAGCAGFQCCIEGTMKILALEKEVPVIAPDLFRPHLKAEARRVWELQQSGVLREVWFTARDHTAVLMLECESAAQAGEVLKTLPLVQAGLITFDILPLVPYDGFARLFAEP